MSLHNVAMGWSVTRDCNISFAFSQPYALNPEFKKSQTVLQTHSNCCAKRPTNSLGCMKMGPWREDSSKTLIKPGIEPATPFCSFPGNKPVLPGWFKICMLVS